MVSAAQLLSTKLYIPQPRPMLVPRPRLEARLSQGLARPLTLISAPAGSGKTTLVSEWRGAAGRDIPLAWLSLEAEDNDPGLFLAYLTAALKGVKPDLGDASSGLLGPSQPQAREALLASLINDLGELPNPFVLVLDDYHAITDGEIHAAVTFFIDHLPSNMHVMLLTRADPPLPLARLRARDQLVEIRAGDLRFTPGEAADFLRQTMGLALSGDEVAVLAQRTEGWIAGLQLAGLALQTPRALEWSTGEGLPGGLENDEVELEAAPGGFSGAHMYVADYLSSEVLSRQTAQVQDFLLRTSILHRMTAGLCDSLTGRSDSREVLRQLDQANLFLVPLDNDAGAPTWYRYHHLFADLLRSRLNETSPALVPELHRRAAAWFEQHALVSETITHALAGGDRQQAARVIEQNAMARLARGDAVTVLRWIDAVAPLLEERPWLGIYQSWARLVTGEIGQIETRLQAGEAWAESHAGEPGVQEMESHIAAIRVMVAGRYNKPRLAVELARTALEHLPESETTMRSIITFTMGDMSWSVGDLSEARRAFIATSRIQPGASDPLVAVLALSSAGMLDLELGELHRAADTFRAVIQKSALPSGRIQPVGVVACLGLASLEYEWNDLDAAEAYARQAADLGARWGNPDTLANTHLLQSRIRRARGDTDGALESLRQAEELARGPGVTPWSALRIDAFRVRMWLAQGQLGAAEQWARQNALDAGDEISYPRQYAYLSLARILAAQGQTSTALALTRRLLEQLEALGQAARALELLLFQAITLEEAGEPTAAAAAAPAAAPALAVLARALALGEPEGYLRIFLDEGAPIANLLRRAASRGIAPKYAARLLASFSESGVAPAPSRQPLIEPLTGRELEILRLIADGLTNQEIARRLVLAVGTVKTHTASLYRKLDVSSRTQAVARAGDLKLL